MTNQNPVKLYNLSLDYLLGENVPKDSSKAFEFNIEAAQLGYADAILAMGWFYLNGEGVARDIESATKWYRKSARLHEPKAMFSLGQIAYDEKNYSEALRWFKRAIKAGHMRSTYWLGKLCWRGHGLPMDKKKAMSLFESAAKKKDPEAQRILRRFSRHHIEPGR